MKDPHWYLVKDGESPSFTDDDISPLDDDNGNEESGVAGVLEGLPVLIGPLLWPVL